MASAKEASQQFGAYLIVSAAFLLVSDGGHHYYFPRIKIGEVEIFDTPQKLHQFGVYNAPQSWQWIKI